MEALTRRFMERLARAEPDAEGLAVLGEAEPKTAADAFVHAAADPDLGTSLSDWVPALLASARPGFGARALTDLAETRRSGGDPPLDLAAFPALPRVLGSSDFLARLLLRRPECVDALRGDPPPASDTDDVPSDWVEIRRTKYDGLLRIAARDLMGRPFHESLAELSDLADRCLAAALDCAARETGVRAPALLALGKLGGRELNFSSDVDLLFVYRSDDGVDGLEYNHAVGRLITRLKSHLEERSPDGFGYRVDLELRPEGRSGALANSVEAALDYYASFGAEWERQMLIRLRPVSGPAADADEFATAIAPFVYRSLIDPGVMRNVRAMKDRIEAERRGAGRDLEADLKEGPGGIRDVEFLVQSLQLFYGGPHPELRTGNTRDALDVLAGLGLLPPEVAAALASAYLWLRRAEHAVQLPEEQQTAAFPRERRAQLALARRLGYAEAEGDRARDRLLEDWTAVRNEVRTHFENLVLEDPE
jgi:glutamate-ammonia-ligase adenylyltransferase